MQAEDATFSIWRRYVAVLLVVALEVPLLNKVTRVYRYSELHKLAAELKSFYPMAEVSPFPPKRIFSRSQVRSVALKRQAELDAYLQSVVEVEMLRSSPLLCNFLRQTITDITREKDESRGVPAGQATA